MSRGSHQGEAKHLKNKRQIFETKCSTNSYNSYDNKSTYISEVCLFIETLELTCVLLMIKSDIDTNFKLSVLRNQINSESMRTP